MILQRFPIRDIVLKDEHTEPLGVCFLEDNQQLRMVDIAGTIMLSSKLVCYPYTEHSKNGVLNTDLALLIKPLTHVTRDMEGRSSDYTSMNLPRLGGFMNIFGLHLVKLSGVEPYCVDLPSSIMQKFNINLSHTIHGRQRYSFSDDQNINTWRMLCRVREKVDNECSSIRIFLRTNDPLKVHDLAHEVAEKMGCESFGIFREAGECQLLLKTVRILDVNELYIHIAKKHDLDLSTFAITQPDPSELWAFEIIDRHLRGIAYGVDSPTTNTPQVALLNAWSTMASGHSEAVMNYRFGCIGHPQHTSAILEYELAELKSDPPADIEFNPRGLFV